MFKTIFFQELGSLINCFNFNNCEKQLLAPINLFCFQEEFITAFNAHSIDNEKQQFKKSNILIEDLIFGYIFKDLKKYNNFNFPVLVQEYFYFIFQILRICGSIYLDGNLAETLELLFSLLIINNICTKEKEDAFTQNKILLIFLNLFISWIFKISYSKLGTYLDVVHSNVVSKQQIMKLNSIFIQNTLEGFKNYLNQYTQLSNQDQLALINQ
ncbi:unnamed protein product [Paramecium pentaurelia]|uniref:Uncharacterized protein n=1 Tax=Paramecium pentaurelia TaxID=43138 RepID=A0A8S1YPD1_9CILI|nr:unnamed protein product [Paramecium pentaurelia]